MQDIKAKQNSPTVNIYLKPKHRDIIQREAQERAISISSFFRMAALEKINREKIINNRQ